MYIGKNAPGSHKEDLEREQQEVIRGEHLSASILSDFIFKIHETNLPSYSNVGSGVSVAKFIDWFTQVNDAPQNNSKKLIFAKMINAKTMISDIVSKLPQNR